jgi:hypothetical protein
LDAIDGQTSSYEPFPLMVMGVTPVARLAGASVAGDAATPAARTLAAARANFMVDGVRGQLQQKRVVEKVEGEEASGWVESDSGRHKKAGASPDKRV